MTWPTKKLGEISRIFSGSSAPQGEKYFKNGKYPFVRVFDLATPRSGTELVETRDYVNELAITELNLVEAQKGAIVFPKSGASILNNNRAMLGTNAYVVSHLSAIEVNEDLAVRNWVYYFLSKFDMGKLVSDPGYPSLNISAIEKIKIPLPPLATQKQIVDRLDKIAEAQKLNDELIQTTNELFQSLLHKELNPVRDSKHSNGVNPAGKNWEFKNLEDVTKIIMGQSPSSTSYNESGHGLPFFQGKADFGELYPNTVKYCSAPSRIAEPEDILISVRAPVGDINLAKCKSCIGRGLAAIRGNTKIVEQMFLYFIFKKNEKNWQRQSTGSTFAAITKDKLTDYKIPVPPLEVQKQIVAKLSAVQDYKKQLLEQKAKLKELFDSTLSRSMTNEKKSKDA